MTALPHEAPSVTGCTFVTKRSKTGACECCPRDHDLHYASIVDGELDVRCWRGSPTPHFLGEPLERCGHPESEHKHRGWLPALDCDGCRRDGQKSIHIFTEEP